MARRALRAATLVPGASLRGLVFDACMDNKIPNTFGMLRHFGMPNRNRVLVSESPHLATAALAAALRIDEAEVTARRYPAHGRGHRSFFGLHVMKSRIEDRVRRFSPAAIAAGHLHHPATHELRDLPFSTIGWDRLLDACPCEDEGVTQNWVVVNGTSRCRSCGGSLGRVPSTPVPDHLRPSLEFIARLVDPEEAKQDVARAMLPLAIRHADRTLLHDLVMNLARAIGGDADAADFHKRITALADACRGVVDWPNGLADLSPVDDCPTAVWDWIRRTYTVLDLAGHGPTARARAISRAPTAAVKPPTYSSSGSKGRLSTSLISAMAAARLGGVDETALKQAWDEGRFTQHEWALGARRVRAFDPEEVKAVAPSLRVVGSRSLAASHLGLPLYGLEQLLERRLFAPAPPGPSTRQLESHMAAARNLETELIAASRDLGSELVMPLLEALRHVSGRPKPWGAAIAALLDRTVPHAIRKEGTGAILTRILVPVGDATRLARLDHERMPEVVIERASLWSGVDALECLNGNRSASQLLAGLPSLGRAAKRLYPVAKVLERAADGVTTYDITRRTGLATTQVAAVLTGAGVPQIAPGLWERARAESLTLSQGARMPPSP